MFYLSHFLDINKLNQENMKKHPQIRISDAVGSCNYGTHLLLNNVKVSKYAYNRYVKKSNYAHSPTKAIKSYSLPCGCFLWINKNGRRELSLLPF